MSIHLQIVPLDPFDDAAMTAWHATYFTSTTHQREYSTPWMLEEMRAELRVDNPGTKLLGWSGIVDGTVVCTGFMSLSLLDNVKQAWIDVNTHPDHRRQGYGSAMLEHLVEEARRRDRPVIAAEASYPYDAPADGAGQPNVQFLLHQGFTFGLGDVQRVLDLPADEALLDELVSKAAPHHRDYEIRQFRGPVPDDIIDSFGDLIGLLVTEAPMGEMELEREVFDADRIRADERTLEEAGRTKYTTVAMTGDGTVAAYSDVVVAEHDPGRVYQWGTLSRPEHRGHRLGIAVKAHNLLWLQRERPDLKRLITYNAEVNTYMIAVNDLMGFGPVERLGEFQRKLG